MEAENIIEANNLRRSYREGERQHVVLDSVSLSVRRGEAVAIRGRSGSGKSTLLNLLGAIDAPDSGEIMIAGHDLTTMNEAERTLFRRQHLGFVYQAFNLIPTLSVSDNIRLVLELNGKNRTESDERIAGLLDAVDLGNRSDSYPDVLSGGEQQRVAIARALAHRPSVLIADEPTGNLDDTSADKVIALLESLVRREGGTMLIATHSNALADRCDRTLNIHNGHLETGPK